MFGRLGSTAGQTMSTMAVNEEDGAGYSLLTTNTAVRQRSCWRDLCGFSTTRRCVYRVQMLKTKGAILVLVLNLLLYSYLGISNILLSHFLTSSGPLADYASLVTGCTEALSMILLYPLAGWLADVYYGRYRVIRTSIRLLWVAIMCITGIMALLYVYDGNNEFHSAVTYCLFPLLLIVMYVGMAGLKVNLLVFGTDQLQHSSSEELNAFIAWYAWVQAFGLGLVTYFCYWREEVTMMGQLLIQAALATAAVCLDLLCSKWLVTDPETPNPLRTVARVAKYVAQNKTPRLRSAFTYCEREIPTRIDFAKAEYGGPFSAEQVEDVKTFFRILCVLVTLFGYYIGGEDIFDISSHLHTSKPHGNTHEYCSGKLINLSGSNLFIPAIFVYVPVYEFIVYPMFRHRIPGMLKTVGCGMTLMLLCVFSQFVLDTVGHATASNQVPCLFKPVENDTTITLELSHSWFGIPSALSGLSLIVFYISLYQFVLAQTPYSMKGLMIGLLYMLRGFFSIIRTILTLLFRVSVRPYTTPSCGFWYYLLNFLIGVTGFAIFCIVARKYRRRERGQQVYERVYVEKYFERP